MKRGLIFTATVAALTLGLVGCKPQGGGGNQNVPDVTITNKNDLQVEWFVEDPDRNLQMTIADGTVIADAIYDGDLVVTSSNPNVVSVASSMLSIHAVSGGTATITAKYKNVKTDHVDVTVSVRPTMRVATTLSTTKDDYYLRWYVGSTSYFAKGTKGTVDSGSPYYLDPVGIDDAATLSVASEGSGDYKYSITFSTGKTIGQKRDASHTNIGFSDETGFVKSLFKLNADYSLSCMIPVTSDSSDPQEYFLAAYAGTNVKRLAFQKAAGIPANAFARIVEYGDPIPATDITLDHTSLTMKDGQAGKLVATVSPMTSTDLVEWTSSAPAVVKVVDGNLAALSEGTAVITATAGNVNASCTITVSGALNYGTQDSPLTPEQAHTLLAENFADGTQTPKMMYVSGAAESVAKTYETGDNVTVKLRKTDGTFEDKYLTVYGATLDGVSQPNVNDIIVAKGYAKIYSGEYELAPGKELGATKNTNPSIFSVTAGEAPDLTGVTISPKVAAVDVLSGQKTVNFSAAPQPAAAELGEVQWTVSPSGAGVTIAAGVATVAQTAVEDDQTKQFTITASAGGFSDTATLTVTKDTSGGGEPQSYVVDFTKKTASHGSYGDEWTYGDVTLAGAANNNGNWAYIKMGPKSATISSESYLGTYIKLNTPLTFSVATVTLDLIGKSYNQADEKASVHIESYSDAACQTKVGETTSQETPFLAADASQSLAFTFTAPAANLYYKVIVDVTNTTTYNGVFCLEKVTFASAA